MDTPVEPGIDQAHARSVEDRVATLESEMEDVKASVRTIERSHARIEAVVGTLATKADFAILVGRIDSMGADFGGRMGAMGADLGGRIDSMGARINALDADLGGRIEAGDARLGGRIDALDAKLSGRIDALDAKMVGIDRRLGQVEAAVDGLRRDLIAKLPSAWTLLGVISSGVVLAAVLAKALDWISRQPWFIH